MKFSDLWRWNGEISRGVFLSWGCILFAIKFNLDRLLAWAVGERPWWFWDYLSNDLWRLVQQGISLEFSASMLALALPFAWAGVLLTVKRLRAVGLPLWLAGLFFVPLVKLLFFALLCALPSKKTAAPSDTPPHGAWLGKFIPKSALGSAAMAIVMTTVLVVPATILATTVLKDYGWSIFVAAPFWLGLLSVIVYGYHQPRSLLACCGVASLAVLLVGGAFLALAAEGIICLLMAAPIAFVCAWGGALMGYFVQRREAGEPPFWFFLLLIALLPLTIAAEHVAPPRASLLCVRSAVEIHASPEQVWRHVVAFSELPPPKELLFRAGIAYPQRAEIFGQGAGAVRHCVFSTGAFVEPIEVWDAPRLLKFSVTANPPPMEEWTPYRHIHPPHLNGFLASSGGQFLLTPLPNGHTRLEGTTWYRHNMWPEPYWQFWSDAIIHRIHLRVLRHIKERAEAAR